MRSPLALWIEGVMAVPPSLPSSGKRQVSLQHWIQDLALKSQLGRQLSEFPRGSV